MTTLLDLAITPAQGGPRECGAGRQEGHIYAECGFNAGGAPIEQFLLDHPIPVNTTQLGLSTQGVTLIERQGTYHIVDIVGESHYKYVADFIEEARAIGISRKIQRTAEFSKLTARSTLILIHKGAYALNAAALGPHAPGFRCPCGKAHMPTEACAGYHWYAAEANVSGSNKRRITRTTYQVAQLGLGAPDMELVSAYFMQVPISNLAVIRRKDGSIDQQSRNQANRSSLPVIDADS